jgi:hypothetical protein
MTGFLVPSTIPYLLDAVVEKRSIFALEQFQFFVLARRGREQGDDREVCAIDRIVTWVWLMSVALYGANTHVAIAL